jgi:hypothetical protein
MRSTRLNRKKLIQERKLLKAEVKNLEAELESKKATKRQLTDEITLTEQSLDEKRARLASLEKEN